MSTPVVPAPASSSSASKKENAKAAAISAAIERLHLPSANLATGTEDYLQTARISLQTSAISLNTKNSVSGDLMWSAWYKEAKDNFADFGSFDPNAGRDEGGAGPEERRSSSTRTLSARQISGQFEDEVAKSWEEDWEDEDVEDTFDSIMGLIARHQAASLAAQ